MALQRETRTRALYAVSRELGGLRDPRDVAAAGARHAAQVLHGEAAVFLAREGGLEPVAEPLPAFAADPRETAVAQWSFEHGRPAGAETDTLPAARALYEPIEGSRSRLGVLALELPAPVRPLAPEQRDLLSALARLIAAPLERAQLAAEAERARVAAEGERLRSTLLSSVSHDLRTPLAAITGAASALLEQPPPGTAVARELTSTVLDEADRLNRLVGNLLDMTRLESGTLEPRREWTLARGAGRLGARSRRAPGGRAGHRGARRPRPAARARRRRPGGAGARQPARERAAPRGRGPGRGAARAARASGPWWRCATRAPASPRTRRSASSRSSTGRPAGRAPGSVSRSLARSSPPTGARSRPRCGSPAAPASASTLPLGDGAVGPAAGGEPRERREPRDGGDRAARARGRGRAAAPALPARDSAGARLPHGRGRRPASSALVEAADARARPGVARPRPARPRRRRGHAPHPRVERRADHRRLRARPGDGQDRGPRRRRRRLPDQAVRHRRAARAHAGGAAPLVPRAGLGRAGVRGGRAADRPGRRASCTAAARRCA